MTLYHASKAMIEFPGIQKTKYTKDFSWGFYCTSDLEQAVRRADRGEGDQVINCYSYEPVAKLSVLKFDQMTDEWLDFIAKCRSGQTHSYDIVEGPMVDDTIWNYVNDYLSGRIIRKQFWALAGFRHPTYQISFHTLLALNCLTYDRSEIVCDRKRKNQIPNLIADRWG